MSFNFSNGEEFVSWLEQVLDLEIAEEYKKVLERFWKDWYAVKFIIDEIMIEWGIILTDINDQIKDSWYQIYVNEREGIYYLDFLSSKKVIVPKIQWQIDLCRDLVISASISWIDFSKFEINGTRYTEYEFVQKIREIVQSLISWEEVEFDWEVSQEELWEEDPSEVEKYNIPEWFEALRAGAEKLWQLYEANFWVPIPIADIIRLTGIPQERISGTHGNLKTRFKLWEERDIKSLGRIRPWYVYCNVSEFPEIKTEYMKGGDELKSDTQGWEDISSGEDILKDSDINEGTSQWKEDTEIQRVDNSDLFREGTAPYELYKYFLNSQWETTLAQAKASGVDLSNGTVTLKSINDKLAKNDTGQCIKSVEWKRGVYEFTDEWWEQDVESIEDLQGELFWISGERMSKIVLPNKKIFNLNKITVKWIELTVDEFIFCVLCWEDQSVWIDYEELKESLLDWISKTWMDVIQFKVEIERKLWSAKIEFVVPSKESLLLREQKNQNEYAKRFFTYMQNNPWRIIPKDEIWWYLEGIGTPEKFQQAFYQAGQLNSWNKSIIHKVWWGWDAFYYGDFDTLEKLRKEQPTSSDSETPQDSEPEKVNHGTQKKIKVALLGEEKSTITESNPELNIDYELWQIDGIDLKESEFNVFMLCVLKKGIEVHPNDIFTRLTRKDPGSSTVKTINKIREDINTKFALNNRTDLFLRSTPESDFIWFWELKVQDDRVDVKKETGKNTQEDDESSDVDGGAEDSSAEDHDSEGTHEATDGNKDETIDTGDRSTGGVKDKPIDTRDTSNDDEDKEPEEEETSVTIMKGNIVFEWDTESWLIVYEGWWFDLNEVSKELGWYITRLLNSDKDEVKIKTKWSKNPENEKHRITKELEDWGLPFVCWNVHQKLIPFSAKV